MQRSDNIIRAVCFLWS